MPEHEIVALVLDERNSICLIVGVIISVVVTLFILMPLTSLCYTEGVLLCLLQPSISTVLVSLIIAFIRLSCEYS